VGHVAVGAASPIPATAALLARERANLHNLRRLYVSLLGSRAHTFFADGARELFDCAGQGRIDVFFLSGGQIDGGGNINLVSVGDYDHPKARFPGSFGSAYLYYVVPKVILFRVEHSRRTLVPKVDFISAPGGSAENVFRPGGPIALVTSRCLFDFDRSCRRFRLKSVHPGQRRRGGRAYRLRLRPAGGRSRDSGAVRGDAAPDARHRRADAGRGLSAIRQKRVRRHGLGSKSHVLNWPLGGLVLALAGKHCTPRRVMVFKRPQPEHDPEKWKPVFGKDHAQT
jgi:hypothetical protein